MVCHAFMPQRLLLLTGSFEAGILAPRLANQSDDCAVRPVDSLKNLEAALAEPADEAVRPAVASIRPMVIISVRPAMFLVICLSMRQRFLSGLVI